MENLGRNEMLDIIKKSFPNGVENAIEIGVYKGVFAKQIYNRLSPKKLFLVDPWIRFSEAEFKDYLDNTQEDWNAIYEKVKKDLGRYSNVEILRTVSLKAVQNFWDRYFDFIYIDANHKYEYALEDMRAWFPKLKVGGFFCGHDFDLKGVNQAVKEFSQEKNLQIFVTTKEKHYKSFYALRVV